MNEGLSIPVDEIHAARLRGIAAAGRFRVPFRMLSWRGASGSHAGNQTGSSLDFQDQRNYLPGDDPRHINWQAYARSGNYTMKLFRDEVRPVLDLVLDASASMWFDRAKAVRTMELLHLLVESAAVTGASVTLRAVAGEGVWEIEPGALGDPSWLERVIQVARKHPQPVPAWDRLPSRQGAIRIVLSDLLFPAEPATLLKSLSRQTALTLVLAPYADIEAKPGWSGNYDFVDAESGQVYPLRVGTAEYRRYQSAYAAHQAAWHQASLSHRTPLARVAAEPELGAALQQEAIPAGVLELTRS